MPSCTVWCHLLTISATTPMSGTSALLHCLLHRFLLGGQVGHTLVPLLVAICCCLPLPHNFHESLITCQCLKRVFPSTARAFSCEKPLPAHYVFVAQYTLPFHRHGLQSRGYDVGEDTFRFLRQNRWRTLCVNWTEACQHLSDRALMFWSNSEGTKILPVVLKHAR